MSRTAHKLMASSGGDTGYEIDSSLLFDTSLQTKLKRTPSSGGNRRTYTWSGWIKRATNHGGAHDVIWTVYQGSGNQDDVYQYLAFHDDNIEFSGYQTIFRRTNSKFRDLSGWMHIVVAVDTTQGTADNRIKLYVNGDQITSFQTKNNPSQNADFPTNHTFEHVIGEHYTGGTSYPFDGYLAEVHHIDGTALTASSFGETDSDSGEWIPKEYKTSDGAYGTNGYYLPFKKNDRYSTYFGGGSTVGLTTPDHTDFTLGTSNFTVETWVRSYQDAGATRYISGQGPSSGANAGFSYVLMIDTNNKPVGRAFYGSSYVDLVSSTAIVVSTWYHIAFVRNSNTFTLYLNGTSVASSTNSITVNEASTKLGVGVLGEYVAAGQFQGWISNFRLVVGTAVYTSNFTPSTSPLTAITNTKLLCCQDSTVTAENSGTSKTLSLTASSSTYTERVSPFIYDWDQDHSGQDNHWTGDNYSSIKMVMGDSPTNNFPTLDGDACYNATISNLREGNLLVKAVTYNNGYYGNHIATFKVPESGKWYFESFHYAVNGTGNTSWMGVMPQENAIIPKDGTGATDGEYITNSSFTGIQVNLITGTDTIFLRDGGSIVETVSGKTNSYYICALALDVDNNKVYAGFDNGSSMTWMASGNPAAGSNGQSHTFTNDTIIQIEVGPNSTSNSNSGQVLNFGQNPGFSRNFGPKGNTDGNGVGDFYYAPPSGFLALCSKNLPDPTIKNGTEHINTVLYTGNDTTNNITGMGFQPDLVWINNRSEAANHMLHDVVSGNTLAVRSDVENAGSDQSANFTAFASDGFNLAASSNRYNDNGENYYAHGWKAGGATTTNVAESGSGTSRINQSWRSTNTDAGFSLIKYVGSNDEISNTQHTKVTHGLSKPPTMVWIKHLSETYSWSVMGDWMRYAGYTSGFNDWRLPLDTTAAIDGSSYVGTTDPDSTYIYVGNSDYVNDDGDSYICYAWHEVEGYSKFGVYEGNGSTDGPSVYTGFKPQWVMFRRMNTSGTNHWMMFNYALDPDNPVTSGNWADYTAVGEAHDSYAWYFKANGFKIKSSNASSNTNGGKYMYMAFAEAPSKYANAR